MNKDKQLTTIEKTIKEEQNSNGIIEHKVINPEIFMAKRTAPFSIAIDKAINDNKQLVIDLDDNQNYHQNALVTYNKRGKHTTEILFKNFFENMSPEEFDKFRQQDKTIRESGGYNTFTKKVKHIFEGKLFEQYGNQGNGWIIMKDKDIADMMNKPQSYVSANMPLILDQLSDIQIKSFIMKGKSKLDSFEKVNIIEAVKHEKGTTFILFGSLYAYYLTQWGFTQYPLELLGTDDKNYRLAFDIGSYIAEMKYQNRTKVKIKSIYERVTAIPRYEDVRDNMHRKYAEKIYEPFNSNIEYLNSFAKTFTINPENTDYINANGTYDFEKWLDTNMIITWNIEPQYKALNEGRKEAQKQANKKKRQRAKKQGAKMQEGEQITL